MAPFLMETPEAENLFPPDAIARAKLYLKNLKGGLGAYSDSKGNPYIRQEIADFIERQTGSAISYAKHQGKSILRFCITKLLPQAFPLILTTYSYPMVRVSVQECCYMR